MASCRHVRRIADREFVAGVSERKRRVLAEHVAACDACRGYWAKLAIVDRRLGGPALHGSTVADIAANVVAGAPAAGRPRRLWIAGGFAAAAAAVVLAVVVLPREPDETLRARGHGVLTGRTPGVRVFCVSGDGQHVTAEMRLVSDGPVPVIRCTIDSDLQLAYTTPSIEGLTMNVFGRRGETIVHYAPAVPGQPVALHANRVDELVAWSTRLRVNHAPGTYDVRARVIAPDASTVELRGQLEIIEGDPTHDR